MNWNDKLIMFIIMALKRNEQTTVASAYSALAFLQHANVWSTFCLCEFPNQIFRACTGRERTLGHIIPDNPPKIDSENPLQMKAMGRLDDLEWDRQLNPVNNGRLDDHHYWDPTISVSDYPGISRLSILQFIGNGNHMSPCYKSSGWQVNGTMVVDFIQLLTKMFASQRHWNASHLDRTKQWQNNWEMPLAFVFGWRGHRSSTSPCSSAWAPTAQGLQQTCDWITEDWTILKRSKSSMSNQAKAFWNANLY